MLLQLQQPDQELPFTTTFQALSADTTIFKQKFLLNLLDKFIFYNKYVVQGLFF